MSIQYLFSNNASTTLASPITASATTLTVYPGQGNLFPTPSSGQGFTLTLTDAATGLLTEIMLCTNRIGDSFTVTRSQEGTTAKAWSAGDYVNNFITAGSADNWIQSSAFGSLPGTYGTATQIPVVTVNSSGQITAISTVTTTANYCAGGWNAATNTPTLVSGIGQNGVYYVVTTAGTTNLNGNNNWQIGDQALFANGSWIKVAGSQSEAFQNITVSALTGYMYANGTNQVTASTTIPNSGLAHSTIVVNGTTLTLGDTSDIITANTTNALTFNNSGSGTSSGNSFNGGTAVTVSYNTIGAPSTSGTGASGTWGIGITGNAASSTVATNLQGGSAYALPYQTGAGATAYLSPGTSGYVLTTNGTGSAPTWTNVSSIATTTFSAGTTGFTPNTATNGAVTLAGTLNVANGGTGATTLTGYVYGNGTSTMTASTTIPTTALSGTVTNAQLANSSVTYNGVAVALGGSGIITATATNALTIGTGLSGTSYNGSTAVTIANTGVLSISGGTTGLTPSTATTGAVTLGGTLNVANGGTGLTSLSVGYIPYGNGTSALASNSGFTFVGNTLTAPVLSVNSTTSTTPNLTFNASNSGITSGATIANNYLQTVIQNKSATSGASTNYVLSNDLGTDSTYYGEFGMNSSGYTASGTIPDFYSINNGIYFSGHDGDISVGSGNGYKLYFPWGATGASAHVINASGALGFSTNLGTSSATSGTTGYGTTGQALVSNGSSAAPSWSTLPTSGGGTGLTSFTANGVVYASSTSALTTGSALTFNGAILGVNGVSVGRGAGAVATNTAVGASALAANTTGFQNTAGGANALAANTTGAASTAFGNNTLQANTTGSYNVALGANALNANTTASNNTAVGYQAGYSNTTGSANVYLGMKAGYTNSTSAGITAVGHNALLANTASDNTAVGYLALYANTTGQENVAVGGGAFGIDGAAMQNNTTGFYNVAVGHRSLASQTTGSQNTAIGYKTLYANVSGKGNVAIGSNALYANTADYNVAIGGQVNGSINAPMVNNTTGTQNIAIGTGSLGNNSTGSFNVAVGHTALQANTTASNNTALGGLALASNTTASNNTAVGYQAGYSNTTSGNNTYIGYQAGGNATGNGNVGVGVNVPGFYNSTLYSATGNGNTALGAGAGAGISSGSTNIAIGNTAMAGGPVTGSTNIAIGWGAGIALTSGSSNTFVGSGKAGFANGAGCAMTTGSGNLILGNFSGNQGGLDIRTSSNNVVLSDGDGNVAGRWANGGGWYQLNNSASWSTTSDARIKEKVETIVNGLDVVMALRPVEFDYKISKKHTAGFIAQEYEVVLPDQIIEDSNISDELKALTNGEPVKGIQQNLVPYLVSAIQTLKAEFDAYKAAHP